MNRLTDWQVAGTLANGERFAVVVSGWYGYDAMKNAKKIVGKIASGCAIRVEHFPTDECAECGEDVPEPYQPTHACVTV